MTDAELDAAIEDMTFNNINFEERPGKHTHHFSPTLETEDFNIERCACGQGRYIDNKETV